MKSRWIVVCFVVLSILIEAPCWSASADASPSFNCNANRLSSVEETICGDETLSSYDSLLAAIYSELLQESSDSERERVQQKAWLKTRNTCAEADCLRGAYLTRINALDNLTVSDTGQGPNHWGAATSRDRAVLIQGKTAKERIAFLGYIEEKYDNNPEIRNRFCAEALKDPDPTERGYAAYSIRGTYYTARLIDVMVTDPDPAVRASAADGLNHWLTDNGVDTCQDSTIVERHLDQLLKGLDDKSTVDSTVRILGWNYSGEKPLVCCMQQFNRRAAIAALTKVNVSPAGPPGVATPALENDAKCP